jgi:hypothetical protein
MRTVATPTAIHREPDLHGQTVVVIGGSAAIGFETARTGGCGRATPSHYEQHRPHGCNL